MSDDPPQINGAPNHVPTGLDLFDGICPKEGVEFVFNNSTISVISSSPPSTLPPAIKYLPPAKWNKKGIR